MSAKLFICECGKAFTKSQSFNGHKSSCNVHIKAKYGDVESYWKNRHRSDNLISITLKNRAKKRKQEELDIWISEKHTCEKCGKIMTEKYGSGRFC